MNIIDKIKQANLVGRGGASFPVASKWEMVKNAPAEKKYVICNASEGEPGVRKDEYILTNYPAGVINGMMIAIDYLLAEKGFIYMNPYFFAKVEERLKEIIDVLPIAIFKKDYSAGYIGGEETSAVNHLEGRRVEPRLKPPFPTTSGLWDYPTLINNVETFYNISLVAAGKYRHKKFYTISGDCPQAGVYEFPEDWTIEKILKKTGNYPEFNFFAQIGGDASGEVLNSMQLGRPASGAGSITIYDSAKHDPIDLMRQWVYFFANESCGQCTPCREGTYRLREIFDREKIDWHLVDEILNNLNETSFCGLGGAVPIPFRTYMKNVLPEHGFAQTNTD